MIKFYLFRHGETDWNAKEIVQGHSNIPLNDNGRKQAEVLINKIDQLNLDIVYSSDLDRAYETAQIACRNTSHKIIKTSQLREANFGDAEGMSFDEVYQKYGDFISKFRFYKKEYGDLSFPNGESRRASIERLKNFIESVKKESRFLSVGISTHGGVIRNLLQSYQNIDNPKEIEIPNCVLYELSFDVDKVQVKGPL